MDIKLEESGSKGMFYIEKDGQQAGKLTFSKAGERIIIDHTEVTEALKGQNAGKQLVAAAVSHARENHLKIIPLCPFAKSVFERVKEYQDVLD